MNSSTYRFIEYSFFFALLLISGYLVWKLFLPFLGALMLAAIVAVICYPLHEQVRKRYTYKYETLAALSSLFTVIIVVVTPLAILASLILREALAIYTLFNSSDVTFIQSLEGLERFIQQIIPTFSLDIASIVQQTAGFVIEHLVSIFAGTASTIFLFFISLIATFYFFRDGRQFTTYLIRLSPLKDFDDSHILERLARAVRSVALGTISVAVIQGTLTAIGLALLGFDRAILWGCIAAIGALVPGLGTTIVFVPAVAFLLYGGAYVPAIILTLWGVLAVGLIDNLIGPHLMSRGNNIHPFFLLLSVLGGLALFGPIGFIVGPVIFSLFLVLLELYQAHIQKTSD